MNQKNPPHIFRVKNRADFLRIRFKGDSVATKSVVIQFARSSAGADKISIGFTATKKIGKANVRNRAKRRLRSAISNKFMHLKHGYDIVLIARAGTALRTWDKLLADLDEGLKKANLLIT